MTTSPRHTTGTPAASQPPSLLNLPEGLSPDSIDTLPVLYSLLSRLQNPNPNPNPNPPASNTGASTSGSPPAATPGQTANGAGTITVKDIPLATDELKHKLQKARVKIRELPDVERSIQEQEDEMRELEEKIRKQREVLEGLREMGRNCGKVIPSVDDMQT